MCVCVCVCVCVVSSLLTNLQVVNFQRCEHSFTCPVTQVSSRVWRTLPHAQLLYKWLCFSVEHYLECKSIESLQQLALCLLLLMILELYLLPPPLPPPVSNSSLLFAGCQHLYASCCTVSLYTDLLEKGSPTHSSILGFPLWLSW